jgi:hypothetical protein
MMRASAAMSEGSPGTSVWDHSHPFCRVVRPASMRSTFGRVLATHHVLPSIAPFEYLGVLPLTPHDCCSSDRGRAAVLIDGLRGQVESSAEVTLVVLFRVQ